MDNIESFCCGNCIYYNGDMTDKQAFCDEREDYVQKGFYCYRYSEKNIRR